MNWIKSIRELTPDINFIIFVRNSEGRLIAEKDFSKIKDNATFQFIESEIIEVPKNDEIINNISNLDTIDALLFFTAEFGEVNEFFDLNQANFMHTLNVNFFSQMQIISQLVKLGKIKNTKIILSGGGGASSDLPKFLPYALSKTLIVKFAEVASNDLKQFNSSINVIAPGLMNSPLTQNIIKKYEQKIPIEFYSKLESTIGSGVDSIQHAVSLLNFLLLELPLSVTGHYISAQWDQWKILRNIQNLNLEFGKLRRIDKLEI